MKPPKQWLVVTSLITLVSLAFAEQSSRPDKLRLADGDGQTHGRDQLYALGTAIISELGV